MDERHYPVETCTSWDDVWIPSGDIDGLKLDGRFIHGDVYGEFRQSATTRFIMILDLRRMKLERGTTERVFDGLPIWRSFQNWKNIFQSFLTLRSWKILWNQIYLLELLQVLDIEYEDVNELVSDQCLLAYTASSTSLTLKV